MIDSLEAWAQENIFLLMLIIFFLTAVGSVIIVHLSLLDTYCHPYSVQHYNWEWYCIDENNTLQPIEWYNSQKDKNDDE